MVTSTNSSSGFKSPDQVLHEAADTYRERNSMYGDNFRIFPAVMKALFPSGITLKTYEDWMRIQFMMLDAVKSTRYAQNFHLGGHQDSIRDKAVYAAMQETTDAEFDHFRSQQRPQAVNEDNGQS